MQVERVVGEVDVENRAKAPPAHGTRVVERPVRRPTRSTLPVPLGKASSPLLEVEDLLQHVPGADLRPGFVRVLEALALVLASCGSSSSDDPDLDLLGGEGNYDIGGGIFYVTAGADPATADGTETHPYGSLAAAVAALSAPAKTILIAPGTYDEPTQIILTQPKTRLLGYRSKPRITDGFLSGFDAPTTINLSYPTTPAFGEPVFGAGLIEIRASDVVIAGLDISVTASLNHAIRAGRPYDAGIRGIHIHHNQVESKLIAISFHRAASRRST